MSAFRNFFKKFIDFCVYTDKIYINSRNHNFFYGCIVKFFDSLNSRNWRVPTRSRTGMIVMKGEMSSPK